MRELRAFWYRMSLRTRQRVLDYFLGAVLGFAWTWFLVEVLSS